MFLSEVSVSSICTVKPFFLTLVEVDGPKVMIALLLLIEFCWAKDKKLLGEEKT
jgi:hypothetical protein